MSQQQYPGHRQDKLANPSLLIAEPLRNEITLVNIGLFVLEHIMGEILGIHKVIVLESNLKSTGERTTNPYLK